ncbi:hypothetical protein [Tepidiphilus sp. HLB4]
MRYSTGFFIPLLLLAACAQEPPVPSAASSPGATETMHRVLEADQRSIWGGDVRCDASSCLLAAVLHTKGAVAVWRFAGRAPVRVAEAGTNYHPDHARWLADGRLAVAVEAGASIDVFRLQGDALLREQQVPVGFPPRAVIAADFDGDGREDLIAAPYSGKALSWMPGRADGAFAAGTPIPSCATPWHVKLLPGAERPGLIAGCLDDKTLTVWDNLGGGRLVPRTVLRFDPVPRDVAVSPDGRTAWVALELGGHGAKVDLSRTPPAVTPVPAPSRGYVAVDLMSDGTLVWGEDRRVILQRMAADGTVETRMLPVSGFATPLQVADLDRDGVEDLVVYNSTGKGVDVWFGPLWEQAHPLPIEDKK